MRLINKIYEFSSLIMGIICLIGAFISSIVNIQIAVFLNLSFGYLHLGYFMHEYLTKLKEVKSQNGLQQRTRKP